MYFLYTTRPFPIYSLSAVTNIVRMTCLPICNIFGLFDDTKILYIHFQLIEFKDE